MPYNISEEYEKKVRQLEKAHYVSVEETPIDDEEYSRYTGEYVDIKYFIHTNDKKISITKQQYVELLKANWKHEDELDNEDGYRKESWRWRGY